MSHFSVLVIGDNVEAQLAPYQENNMGDCPKEYLKFKESTEGEVDPTTGKRGYWNNPNSKWDWYVIGGRWSGFFKSKHGGMCDVLKKGEIDWKAMRDENERKAIIKYDFAMTIIGHLPPNESWAIIRDQHGKNARDAYWSQPRCKAWKDAANSLRSEFEAHGIDSFFEDPDQFLVSRDKYITMARNRAGCTFAVVKDGKWYERGSMGWWGTVIGEKDEETWVSMYSNLIDELPEDTTLTVVDCHI